QRVVRPEVERAVLRHQGGHVRRLFLDQETEAIRTSARGDAPDQRMIEAMNGETSVVLAKHVQHGPLYTRALDLDEELHAIAGQYAHLVQRRHAHAGRELDVAEHGPGR